MAAASLQRASGGRFALGLGASSPPLVEGLHGLTWEQPVDRMRATLVAVRALLDGARLPLEREGVRPLRLGAPPERPCRSSSRRSPRPRSGWRASSQTTGCPSSGPARGSPEGRALLAEGEARRRGPDRDRRRRQRPARDRRGRGDGAADRRGLAARLPHAHGPALSADAPRSVRVRARGGCAARSQRGRRGAAAARGRGAAGREVTVMGTYDGGAGRRARAGSMRGPTPSTSCCRSECPRSSSARCSRPPRPRAVDPRAPVALVSAMRLSVAFVAMAAALLVR